MKFGVVVFPGSNCDHDAQYAVTQNVGAQASFLWHQESSVPSDIDAIILPGGFSYGDYLRCGAIAKFSPIIGAVKKFAHAGGLVMGFCNGFQILTESGLLPGALVRNNALKFICRLDQLEAEDRVVFRYVKNPNGSLRDIAGICNAQRNVLGMMPHPERAADPLMGSTDGLVLFHSLIASLAAK